MVVKPTVLNWHREEFAQGKKENIPADALAILEASAEADKKEDKKPEKKKADVEVTK